MELKKMKLKNLLAGAAVATVAIVNVMPDGNLEAANPSLESIKSGTTIQSQSYDYGNEADNICVNITMNKTKVLGLLGRDNSLANAERTCGISKANSLKP